MPKSSFRKKPGYKARTTGKKRGRVKFSRVAATKEWLYRKYPSLQRARKKDFKKRRTAVAKAKAKRRRRDKKINKVVSRVLTDMNDAKATMYRQYVAPDAFVVDGNGNRQGLDGAIGDITDGDFVTIKDPALQYVVKRNETDFFQIEDFHGLVAPSWQQSAGFLTAVHDNETNPDTGVMVNDDNSNPNPIQNPPISNRIDIRAFREVEIPFLPCIPSHVGKFGTSWGGLHNVAKVRHELGRFCRENNKIKITNNYMRFRFFATPNGHVEQVGGTSDTNPSGGGNLQPAYRMTGDFTNIEPTFAARAETGALLGTNTGLNDPKYGVNEALSYKITGRRFAKVRILLYERKQEEVHKVELAHFMKYGEYNLGATGIHEMQKMPGGALFVSEEYRLNKRFTSPLKKKNDLPYMADISTALRLMDGKLIIDKVINLPMNQETVFTCNPIAGTVLEYDDVKPRMVHDDEQDANTSALLSSTAITSTETETVIQTDHSDEDGLRTHVNGLDEAYYVVQDTPNPWKAEYKPKNKQYGMFMLFYCQRAGIEYDIFQKFEYDK